MWHYQAQLSRVVDGDTQDLVVDLGFNCWHHIRVRLKDVDTAEVYGVDHESEEYQRGKRQTEWVRDWYAEAFVEHDNTESEWPLVIRSEQTGKYGRWLATVERKCDNEMLNEAIIERWPNAASDYNA